MYRKLPRAQRLRGEGPGLGCGEVSRPPAQSGERKKSPGLGCGKAAPRHRRAKFGRKRVSESEKQESRLWQAERSWLKKGPAALLAHLRQAAENGPGVLPLQRHAERLEELLSALTSSQAEAGRVEAAEITPGFDRNRAPAPEGNELQALATAKSFCVLKAALAVLVGGSDLPRMKGRRSHGAALEATGDGQVESGRVADAPGRKIHIGWAPAGWLAGARFAGTKFGRTRRKQS